MANPCGTRTPCPDSFWNISPSDAFFPPTSGTSSMPNSSKKRTYPDVLMTCPLIARQAVGSIEPDAHVMRRRTRPISLPDTAVLIVQAAQEAGVHAADSGTHKFTPRRSSTPVPAFTCDSATNANLPQRHARCQGRRSPEWATARPEVASAARTHAHQPTAKPARWRLRLTGNRAEIRGGRQSNRTRYNRHVHTPGSALGSIRRSGGPEL